MTTEGSGSLLPGLIRRDAHNGGVVSAYAPWRISASPLINRRCALAPATARWCPLYTVLRTSEQLHRSAWLLRSGGQTFEPQRTRCQTRQRRRMRNRETARLPTDPGVGCATFGETTHPAPAQPGEGCDLRWRLPLKRARQPTSTPAPAPTRAPG